MPIERTIVDRARVVLAASVPWILFVFPGVPFGHANEWVELALLNRSRGEHANAVIDGKIYVMGGIFDSTDGPDEIEVFDPIANTWTDIGMMPLQPENRSRHHFTIGASVYDTGGEGHEIWVVGGKTGGDTTGTNFVDVYNVVSGEWRTGPDLPEVLWGGPSVIVGDTLHAFAGAQEGRTDTANHHYSLDLSDSEAAWQREIKVPRPRVHAAGASVGDKIYLIGGELDHTHDVDTKTVQIYDTQSDEWSEGADLPMARSHAEWATFTHAGEIWSVGGVDSSNAPNRGQSEIFIYNPTNDAWRPFEYDLPVGLVSPGAKIIDNTLFVYGGGENNWFDGEMRKTYALELPQQNDSGDLDRDGVVSGSDFLLWQRYLASNSVSATDLSTWLTNYPSLTMSTLDSDFNNDGVVSGSDFLLWQQTSQSNGASAQDLLAWETSFAYNMPALLSIPTVPEPRTLVAFSWVAVTAICLRKLNG